MLLCDNERPDLGSAGMHPQRPRSPLEELQPPHCGVDVLDSESGGEVQSNRDEDGRARGGGSEIGSGRGQSASDVDSVRVEATGVGTFELEYE